jgi:hypothetical protein
LEVQTHPLAVAIPRFIQLLVPLLSLRLMAQSRRGVNQMLEVLMHPLTKAIPRFIQMNMPLLLLKLMAQSRRGVTHLPNELPHTVIEPSALRAAKANLFE